MRRNLVMLVLSLAVAVPSLLAQEEPEAPNETPAPAAPAQAAPAAPAAPAPAPAPASAPAAPAAQGAAAKQDALVLYQQGRNLEAVGKQADAQAKYVQGIAVCDREIQADPKRLEAYVVKCWCLFRLNRHSEVIAMGQAGLRISFDARISEVMGESFYFLGQLDNSLKYLQRYLEVASDAGDRGPTALFFMGEVYLRQKKFSHADIAYSAALSREPKMSRWWFRLGNACEGLGEWKRAYDAYGKALALNPAYAEAQAAQGRVKPKIGQ
jgi:tetratricopeptide (TPR) repeat protein